MAKMQVLVIIAWLFLFSLLATVACSPKAAPTPVPTQAAPAAAPASGVNTEWSKVLDAARKEGKLTFYGSSPTAPMDEALGKPLAEKYGIKMEWVQALPPVNTERIMTEQKSGQYVADLFQIGAGVSDPLQGQGMLLAFTPPVVNREPDVWRDKGIDTYDSTRQQLTFTLNATGPIVVNTKLVKPEDMPRSYKDLLDPKWKGKVAMVDPSILGPGSVTFNLLKRTYGLEYWDKMKGQDVTFIRDYGDLARRVAVGESAVALGSAPLFFPAILKAGAPLKFIAPEEGINPVPTIFNFIRGAPHANAAKVALEYSATKEGQERLNLALGTWSIRKDVEFKGDPALEEYINGPKKLVVADKQYVSEYVADYQAGLPGKVLGLK